MCYWCDHLKLEPKVWDLETRLIYIGEETTPQIPRAIAPSIYCGTCGNILPKRGSEEEEQQG